MSFLVQFPQASIRHFLPLQMGIGKSHTATLDVLVTQVSCAWPSRVYPATQWYRILSPTLKLVPFRIPLAGTPGFPQELLCSSEEIQREDAKFRRSKGPTDEHNFILNALLISAGYSKLISKLQSMYSSKNNENNE